MKIHSFTSFKKAVSKATGKSGLSLLCVAALLTVSATSVHGQSALDGFDPNANGLVRIVVVQPDGKILLGGDFTTLSPNGGLTVTRNRIARLNPDGTLDATFDPNANSSVYALVVQGDGRILVGGVFTTLAPNGGAAVTRNRIARVNADGTLDAGFDPNANNAVLSIAVQADNMILAGGDFTSIGGLTRNRMARLNAVTGAADLPFDPNANSSVWSIVVRGDGRILVGGSFANIGGQVRNSIARLNPDATLDVVFNPNADGSVRSIAVQADGRILAGGQFTAIGGQTRGRIARLDSTTGAADSFDPNASSDVRTIAVQADGKILAGGFFFTIGGQSRSQIARLNSDGTADSFNPNASSPVHTITVQADGKILVGGQYVSMGGETRNRIARLETDGRLDRTHSLNILGGPVLGIAVQPDGKILIGGGFTSVLGVTRNNLARLNTDGTLDTGFNPNVGTTVPYVYAIAVQTDGKILASGAFTSMGGQPRNNIARVNPDGTLDAAFNPNANNEVVSIAVQSDGKILVGGLFTTLTPNGGPVVTRNRIARLNADGTADSFNPNADGGVDTVAMQADGKILVGGQFFNIGGQSRQFIARLDASTGLADPFNPTASAAVEAIVAQTDGKILVAGLFSSIGGQPRNSIARLDGITGLAEPFDPNASSAILTMAVQADGKILVGGFFTSIGGQARNRIARLDATTGLADPFDPNASATVESILVQPDGKILVGGNFTSIGGQTRNNFTHLSNGTAALQNLAVTQTAVTWTRGGSSPRLERVTFEGSVNGVSYTLLGNGTAAGSDWTLTGLNFSTGQYIDIRARGYYRAGFFNGSESITESIRSTFLIAEPTPTPTPTPPATVSIAGPVLYCSGNPVPGVTMTLNGGPGGVTMTDGSGNYLFSLLPSGGSYTVTPTKTALAPASTGINTVDVIAVQRHFLNIGTPLSACRLAAADVDLNTSVNTVDVIGVQRFFLGLTTGIANAGKYKFTPVSRSYVGLVSNQTNQGFTSLIFGDVSPGFVHRP